MVTARSTKRRIALIWNIATCAVIVCVLLFVAVRTASPVAFVVAAVLFVVLAVLVRRYRYAKRIATVASKPERGRDT